MQAKTKIFIGLGIGLVIIGILTWFLLQPKATQTTEKKESVLTQVSVVPTVSGVKVSVTKQPDGKRVLLNIDSIPSIYSDIEYEISYNTNKDVPRGVIGTITVSGTSYEKEIVLGSCSTNTCTYDEGVEKIKVSLKFNTANGDSAFFENEFSL